MGSHALVRANLARRLLLGGLSAVLLLMLAACAAPGPAEEHPAAVAVNRLLVLRRNRSTDVEAYKRHLADSEVASDLAHSANELPGEPIPKWRRPYVSRSDDTSAEVVVVWQETATFREWPTATLFRTERAEDGRWVVVDARVLRREMIPPPEREGGGG